jgi:hypothetical protein
MQLYDVLAEVKATCPEHDRILSQRFEQLADPAEWSFTKFGMLWDAAAANWALSHAPCRVIHNLAELAEAAERASGGLRVLVTPQSPRKMVEGQQKAA